MRKDGKRVGTALAVLAFLSAGFGSVQADPINLSTAIANAATSKGSVTLEGTGPISVTSETTADPIQSVAIKVSADTSGGVGENSTSLVTGGQVYNYLHGNTIDFGGGAVASGTNSIAIGSQVGTESYLGASTTQATGLYSIAIGVGAEATGTVAEGDAYGQTIAIGVKAAASGNRSQAIGFYSEATGQDSLATGGYSMATGRESAAYGNESIAAGLASTAVGSTSNAAAVGSTATGYGAQTGTLVEESVEGAVPYTGANNQYKYVSGGEYASAYGTFSKASGSYSTAMGTNTIASGRFSTAIGTVSKATGALSTVVGAGAESTFNYASALGTNAKANAVNSVALGNDSIATAEKTVSVGRAASGTEDQADYVAGFTRKIVNVTNGEESHDAATWD